MAGQATNTIVTRGLWQIEPGRDRLFVWLFDETCEFYVKRLEQKSTPLQRSARNHSRGTNNAQVVADEGLGAAKRRCRSAQPCWVSINADYDCS